MINVFHLLLNVVQVQYIESNILFEQPRSFPMCSEEVNAAAYPQNMNETLNYYQTIELSRKDVVNHYEELPETLGIYYSLKFNTLFFKLSASTLMCISTTSTFALLLHI